MTPAAAIRAISRALTLVPANARNPELTTRARAQVVLEHVAGVPVAILIANDRARYVDANAAATRLTGYSREELLKLSLADLTAAPRVTDSGALWREFLKRGRMAGDYPIRRKDGRVARAKYVAVAHVLDGIHVSALAHWTLMRRAPVSTKSTPVIRRNGSPSPKSTRKRRT